MVRPLTKADGNGVPYRRPAEVEAQIGEASGLSLVDLRARLLIREPRHSGFLRKECLVYLLREGRRVDDEPLMSAILPVLLNRCEANLLVKIPDGGFDDAASLRQESLDKLADLVIEDGTGESPDELDFYECKFNSAFRTLRIDVVRRSLRARKKKPVVEAIPTEDFLTSNAQEDAFARISDAFETPPVQEWGAFRERLVNAIEGLPDDEREAVILVHGLGYKQESDDPDEETAATLCDCTGRTIRNRLTRAATRLAWLKEAL